MKLSLCLPTYNRPTEIKSLLKFLVLEIQRIETSKVEIEIIVGDNSTNNETKDVCEQSELNKIKFFTYIKNVENIGLEGNVVNLIKKATGDYTWLIGDDDIYKDGIIAKICDAILTDDYAYIFINHRAYLDGSGVETGFASAVNINMKTEFEDGKEMVLEIWNKSKTSLMFISASVYNSKALKDCLICGKSIDIAYPLFTAFYCAAQGKGKLIKEICIENIWGIDTWSAVRKNVFNVFVPRILYYLPKVGYNFTSARTAYFLYLIPRITSILKQKLRGIIKKKN